MVSHSRLISTPSSALNRRGQNMCFSSGIWHYHLLSTTQKVRTKNKGDNILNFVKVRKTYFK